MATPGSASQGADRGADLIRRPLVVVGGGEHAAVVVDAARSRPDAWRLVGFTDPMPPAGSTGRLGIEHLGDDSVLADGAQRLTRHDTSDGDDARPWLVLGFGAPADARRRAAEGAAETAEWATVVHAAAWVSPAASLGPGTVVLAGAIINAGASVGAHVIVNTRAVVEHDVVVGDFAHLAPGALIGGGARVGEAAFIGLGALVRDHVSIGRGAVVAMGSVVIDAVADDTTVMGAPAQPRDIEGG
jgi:sugar O-acyltransferase (sialic acid O-acetyltransferase NeuD family)